jgi:hypothetical protein
MPYDSLGAAATGLLHTFDSYIQFALIVYKKMRTREKFPCVSCNFSLGILFFFFTLSYAPSCCPLYADSGGEMASASSDLLAGSTVSENSMQQGPNPSEIHSPVLNEESAMSNGHYNGEPSLCIAVIGATGELARNKVFPALFALYYSGFLPRV